MAYEAAGFPIRGRVMKGIQFIYCQGSGNTFILIDEEKHDLSIDETHRKALAVLFAQSYKVDGLLFFGKSSIGDCSMRIFNTDGSEAEMCGNGIRCIARLMMEKHNLSEVVVEVRSKCFKVIRVDPLAQGVPAYEVKIDDILQMTLLLSINHPFRMSESPITEISKKRKFTALGMPNPHLIIKANAHEKEEEIEKELVELGSKIQRHRDVFPKGINVSIYRPFGTGIFVQTYERGVGITDSCGTAMSAAAIAYTMGRNLPTPSPVGVWNKGGFVHCTVWSLEPQMSVSLQGNATFQYTGMAEYDAEKNILIPCGVLSENHTEVSDYERFVQTIRII